MKTYLNSVKAEYSQEKDDDDDRRATDQGLTVKMTHAGAGPYLVLSTKRWAIDRPDELIQVLAEFEERVAPLFERNDL